MRENIFSCFCSECYGTKCFTSLSEDDNVLANKRMSTASKCGFLHIPEYTSEDV